MKGFSKTQEKKKKRLTLEEARRLSPTERKEIGHLTQHKTRELFVQSRVSSKDKRPMVDFHWGRERMELTPPEALTHALGIIEAAIAAETDALLVEFATRILGAEIDIAGLLLLEFRKFREENSKQLLSWRGQAMTILRAAETSETDNFLRNFLGRITERNFSEVGSESLDIEEIISEFQELRESSQTVFRD